MKGCHNCKHAAAIAAGDYADTAWERVPCASCDVLSQISPAVPFDEGRLTPDPYEAVSDETTDERRLPLSVMRELVAGLLQLRPELRDVVSWRFAGMAYYEIGQAQGVSMQCAEKRHRRAMKLWPALRELFPEKIARREMQLRRGEERRRRGKDCEQRQSKG